MKKGWRGEGGEEKNVEKHTKSVRKTKFKKKKKKSCAQKLANQKARNVEFAFFFFATDEGSKIHAF